MAVLSQLHQAYEHLKSVADADLKSEHVTSALLDVTSMGLDFLTKECDVQELVCDVADKDY